MPSALRVAALLAVVTVSLAAPALAQDWIEHKPDGVGYRVEMPGTPKITSQDVPTAVGTIKTTIATIDRTAIAYMASHNDYPPQVVAGRQPEEVLDGIVRGQVGQHTLREEQKVTISQRPARHVVIDTAQGQVIVIRAVLVETRLFQVLYVGPKGSEAGADPKRFLESFALVER